MSIDKDNKYTQMQKTQYEREASEWTTVHRGPVVGSFDEHNAWADYDSYLFKNIDTTGKIALDFGCGPGRNIVKFKDRFQRIDGVDIAQKNIDNAKIWIQHNGLIEPVLKVNNGTDISCIDTNDYYDVVFSTICMQHICVYDVRFSLLTDFYRVLKPGGSLCIQMGFGASPEKRTVAYTDNFYDADGTNGHCDVRVDSPDQIESDLIKIGFSDFSYDLRPVGPGDKHAQWIFFRAFKK